MRILQGAITLSTIFYLSGLYDSKKDSELNRLLAGFYSE